MAGTEYIAICCEKDIAEAFPEWFMQPREWVSQNKINRKRKTESAEDIRG